MKKIIISFIALSVVLGALLSGCTDSAPSGPTPGLGSVTVKKYVAVGNSLTAGYQSNGLYESVQMYSFPNLISQQLVKAGAPLDTFQQPLYSDPGNADPGPGSNAGKSQRYAILNFSDPKNPVIGPEGKAPGSPTNSLLARPYDNLGIPGIPIASFLVDTMVTPVAGFGPLVLRSPIFPNSVYKQILLMKVMGQTPDLVTFWLGANDVLGFAITGGTSPTSPTNATQFAGLYKQALDSLRNALPSAKTKIIVATIPDVRAIPFFNTVGPKIAASLPAGVYLRYQKHGNTGPSFDSTRLTESSAPLVTLKAGSYAALLKDTSITSRGQWYRDLATSLGVSVAAVIGAGIDTTKYFGLDPRNPLPDALMLDASEQTTTINFVNEFNATIQSVAASDNADVFDAYSFFNGVKANGYSIAGEKYTADYISGGLFSLDGVHPSSRGYAIVANEFIKIMNSKYGMSVPYVDLSRIPGIPMPLGKYAAGSKIVPTISLEAWKSFDALWNSGF